MIPTYKKPPAKRRGKKRPGGKPGHPGSRREMPERIEWKEEHRAKRCPDCNGRLKRCSETRTRCIEDIPALLEICGSPRYPTRTYFMIDRSPGSPALAKFFTEEFNGTLITDFEARGHRTKFGRRWSAPIGKCV